MNFSSVPSIRDRDNRRRRLNFMIGLTGVLFAILIVRLMYVQLIQGEYYERQAKYNQVQISPSRPARGSIYDRNMNVLAAVRPSYVAMIDPRGVRDLGKTLDNLKKFVPDIEPRQLEEEIERQKRFARDPIPILEDINWKTLVALEENRWSMPGLIIEPEARRYYPYKDTAAHVLGHLGRISEEDYISLRDKGYYLGDSIGQMGLEKFYDDILRGEYGKKIYRVDVMGRRLGELKPEEWNAAYAAEVPLNIKPIDPKAGGNLVLTIDLGIQQMAEEVLADRRGVIIIGNPTNGEILALVSKPSFDPNIFTEVITDETWEKVINHNDKPLLNRAIKGIYSPASTFKPIVAAAALETKKIEPTTKLLSTGIFYYADWPEGYKNWTPEGLGWINVVRAITQSDNVFFYKTSLELGIDDLARYARGFGLGSVTGIDLPDEETGLVPDPKWKQKTIGSPWLPGETIIMGIGHGYINVTPLQMFNVTSAIANGGFFFQPRLLKQVRSSDGEIISEIPLRKIDTIPLSKRTLFTIRKGMWSVVNGAKGTARHSQIEGLEFAGKTGTAQIARNKEGNEHSWFISYAPFTNPSIAIVVLVENAGEGREVAAPISKEIIENIFFPNRTAESTLDEPIEGEG